MNFVKRALENGGIMEKKLNYAMNVLVKGGYEEDQDHFVKCPIVPPKGTYLCYNERSSSVKYVSHTRSSWFSC